MTSLRATPPAPSRLRRVLRSAGLGRLCYHIVHASFPRLRWRLRFGWAGAWRYAAGEAAMARAASRLPPVDCGAPGGLACSFLTGKHYWHQTAFAAHSLARQLPSGLDVVIYEDGTLTPARRKSLGQVLRGARFVSAEESTLRLDRVLPASRYPRLRGARHTMPLMRKLLDLRAGQPGWQLYLDSDMLFLGRPDFLLARSARRAACHMLDRIHGYTMPVEELSRLTGLTVPPHANAGIVGLDDSLIDWDQLEHWLGLFPPEAVEPRLLEQTLTALLLGLQASEPAPADAYHILYESDSAEPPEAVLLHFIFDAKFRYFTRDWRRCLGHPAATAPESLSPA